MYDDYQDKVIFQYFALMCGFTGIEQVLILDGSTSCYSMFVFTSGVVFFE